MSLTRGLLSSPLSADEPRGEPRRCRHLVAITLLVGLVATVGCATVLLRGVGSTDVARGFQFRGSRSVAEPTDLADEEMPTENLSALGGFLKLIGCLLLFLLICACCIFAAFATVLVKLGATLFDPKTWRNLFDQTCPPEKKPKYTSPEFRAKCDAVFEKADTQEPFGQLNLAELKEGLAEFLGDNVKKIFDNKCTPQDLEKLKTEINKPDGKQQFDSLLTFWMSVFDDNGDKVINKDEFCEMMKLLAFWSDEASAEQTNQTTPAA